MLYICPYNYEISCLPGELLAPFNTDINRYEVAIDKTWYSELRTFTSTIQSDNYTQMINDIKGMETCIKISNFDRYHASHHIL